MTQTKLQQIDISFEHIELTTAHPFGISYGTSATSHNVIVKLAYEGQVGLGEGSPASYHAETPDTVMAVLNKFKNEKIIGDDPFAISEISRRMDQSLAGNCAAKSAVEIALHDLCGKLTKTPTWKMLGLSGLKAPMTDFTIGIASLEKIESKVKEALEAGYKILKVKQGTDYDRDIIKMVRKHAPDHPLRVDANGAWTPKQAVEKSKFLADNGVMFIEQPLPKFAHVDDFRFVRERSPIPIFADESICRANDVARLAGAIDGVVVKLAKTGGITEALKVITCARAHSLQVMFGCMIESSIGVTAAAQLQSLCDHLDLDGALLLANDPYKGAQYEDGYLHLSDLPGLGVTPR